jgi:hypothetical protein
VTTEESTDYTARLSQVFSSLMLVTRSLQHYRILAYVTTLNGLGISEHLFSRMLIMRFRVGQLDSLYAERAVPKKIAAIEGYT